MIFLSLKTFLEINKRILKNIKEKSVTRGSHGACRHADISMTSSRGSAGADVSMAHADVSVDHVSVDQVNADPVNGQRSLGAHLSAGGSHR